MKAILVTGCVDCPSRAYKSGGHYSCNHAGAMFPVRGIPDMPPSWCPLPEWPAQHINALEAQVRTLSKGQS